MDVAHEHMSPHDVKPKIVLPMQYIRKLHTTIKIDCLRSRQQLFTKCVSSAETGSISNLNFSAGLEGNTLRTIIMEIEHSTIPNQKLFLNIDKHWTENEHTLHFLPQYKQEEARLMITHIIPYLV